MLTHIIYVGNYIRGLYAKMQKTVNNTSLNHRNSATLSLSSTKKKLQYSPPPAAYLFSSNCRPISYGCRAIAKKAISTAIAYR